MNYTLFIALRYLTRRRKEKFISIISVISILGVIVGVAALIVVLSIMTGFDMEIKDRIIGTYSHIVIVKEGGILNEKEVMQIIDKNKHVEGTAPFIDEPAFLRHQGGVIGILIRGIDEEKEPSVTNVNNYISGKKLDFGKNGIIVGSELLRTLRLKKGDKIRLFSPYAKGKFPFQNKSEEFTIVGTFTSGRYDYDANMAFLNISDAKRFLGKDTVSGIGIKVDNEFEVPTIKRSFQKIFRYPFSVKSWMDLDKNLMRALAIEKKMMFIILALIILVACFNIASTLIMQVLEKTKDVGILRAIGATAGNIRWIFIFLGFFIGVIGVSIGTLSGVLISKNINTISDYIESITGFELFPSDIYYLSEIPVKIVPNDVLFIALFSLILAVIAALYPAWKASRLNPVEAISYE